jgi:hypothetical protein
VILKCVFSEIKSTVVIQNKAQKPSDQFGGHYVPFFDFSYLIIFDFFSSLHGFPNRGTINPLFSSQDKPSTLRVIAWQSSCL